MKLVSFASALLALLMMGSLSVVAQEKPKADEKKVEEKFDRGDEKAEKELKKAYIRIASAEAKGLERFKSDAKIVIDTSSTGLPIQIPPQVGKLLWKVGKAPHFEGDKAEAPAPGGMDTSTIAKRAFAPFMSFVFGVEAWDTRFKEANFKYGELTKEEAAAKKKKTYVIVKYKDEATTPETYALEDNKVVGMAAERSLQGQKQLVQYTFVYEDKGKELKIKEVLLSSKMTIPAGAMPGGDGAPDPKNPENKDPKKEEGSEEEPAPEGEDQEGGIDMSVKLTEFATVGKAEICTKLEVTIEVKAGPMQLSIPASMEITNPKGNKDVSDDDLKPMDTPDASGTEGGSDEGF